MYEAGNAVNSNTKNVEVCWRVPSVVTLVQALNMHGNSEGFTGLYPLSSIEVVARGKGEAKSKAIWETGLHDKLWDPGSSATYSNTKQHL